MARSRNIKPGFFTNDCLAECEPLARLLFAGLWTIADRAGRLEDRPRRIKAEVLPYDECDIEDLLGQLVEHGFIDRYVVEHDNMPVIQIVTFELHQNPHVNEPMSKIPANLPKSCRNPGRKSDPVLAPEEYGTSTVQAPESHRTDRADSLFIDSTTDSLIITAPARGTMSLFEKMLDDDWPIFVDQFTRLDPVLTPRWFKDSLRRIEVDVGEMPLNDLRRGLGLAHRQLLLRFTSENGSEPITSPRRYAEKVILAQLKEAANGP